MGDVGHRCVEAVDGLIVEGEWSSIKAESTAEGIEDAVAVVDGNRNGVAIAVGCDAVAAVGFAVVPVEVIKCDYPFRCGGHSGEF